MSRAPKPERRFIEDMRRHPRFGIAFALGVVTMLGYAVWRLVGWLAQ